MGWAPKLEPYKLNTGEPPKPLGNDERGAFKLAWVLWAIGVIVLALVFISLNSCSPHKVVDPVVTHALPTLRHGIPRFVAPTIVSSDSGPIQLSIAPEQTFIDQQGGVEVIYAVTAKNLHDDDHGAPPAYVGVRVAITPPGLATAQPGLWQFLYGTDCTDSTQASHLWVCPQCGDIGMPGHRGYGFGCPQPGGSLWSDAGYDIQSGCLLFGFHITPDLVRNEFGGAAGDGSLANPYRWQSIHEWDSLIPDHPGEAVVGRFRCMPGIGVQLVEGTVSSGGQWGYDDGEGNGGTTPVTHNAGWCFIPRPMLVTLGSTAVVTKADTSRTATTR